ncbi:hypothetical protein OESDEN_17130 [Oesophagostomum dentatum]|uniref:Uncharacterized protein n=1 Tax=Oesophagostomum dentatum TaxID=61180 RepID=A0A0B1SD24_OESDE|nr:hypothetical protein OESDEN_17130 [Oesophagostomum dentatum]
MRIILLTRLTHMNLIQKHQLRLHLRKDQGISKRRAL